MKKLLTLVALLATFSSFGQVQKWHKTPKPQNPEGNQLKFEYHCLMQNLLFSAKHTNTQYLLKPQIAGVVSQALAKTYLSQPQDPVDFFVKALLAEHETTLQML